MMAKVDVNGDGAHPLFKALTAAELRPAGAGPVKWNFEKFVINGEGTAVARYGTAVAPKELKEQLEELLAASSKM